MKFILLLIFMIGLLPSRGPKDLDFRVQLAHAIVAVTDDDVEQLTLVRLAKYESGYRRNVARCETHAQGATMKTEDHGKSFGTFQVQPMSKADAKLACGSLVEQAGLALRYMRRSAEMCPKNTGAATLNLYTSGRCEYGLKQSEERWGGQDIKEGIFQVPNLPLNASGFPANDNDVKKVAND